MRVEIQFTDEPGKLFAAFPTLPLVGQRVALARGWYTVHEAVWQPSISNNEMEDFSDPSATVVLKPAGGPVPIGPGSITKADFASFCVARSPATGAASLNWPTPERNRLKMRRKSARTPRRRVQKFLQPF